MGWFRSKTPMPATKELLFDSEFFRKVEHVNAKARKRFSGEVRPEKRRLEHGRTGTLFRDYRRYSVGDDLRRLDWNIYGRLGELLIKMYEVEGLLHLAVLVDTSASMDWGEENKARFARRLAGGLVYVGLSNLESVRLLMAPGSAAENARLFRGRGHLMGVLQRLETEQVQERIEPLEVVRPAMASSPRGRGVAVVFSDFYDLKAMGRVMRYLSFLRMHTVAVHVVDRLEAQPQAEGSLFLRDAEIGERKLFRVTPRLLRAYRELFREHSRNVEGICHESGIVYMRTQTSQPFDRVLLQLLERGIPT